MTRLQAMNVETTALRPDFLISRIAKGNWQIADDHSGQKPDLETAVNDMFAFAEAGVTTFVCGDIYPGVEKRIGTFLARYRKRHGRDAAEHIKVLTTYVPYFLEEESLRNHSKKDCETIVDRSLQRLRQERLDLVQMHWWNYDIPGHVEMALALQELQRAGKIDQIGATNFDVPRMQEMFDAGVEIVAHTVQYSVLDRRPENGMVALCAEKDCQLIAYGAVGGGLISEKWLGIPDPGKPALENVSLDKYYRIVNDFGGWSLFQELLQTLAAIADKHATSIANVACRYVLEKDQVASVSIGARHTRHLAENLSVFAFSLDDEDKQNINAVLSRSTGPLGDCYGVDRAENRDALEAVKTEYFDIEDRQLVKKERPPVVVDEPYGHYLSH